MDEVTEQLREKYRKRKVSMDSKAVFHPDANAQRVHTMFMVDLQRALNPEEIEDMVLENMQADVQREKEMNDKKGLEDLLEGLFSASKAYVRSKMQVSPAGRNGSPGPGNSVLEVLRSSPSPIQDD